MAAFSLVLRQEDPSASETTTSKRQRSSNRNAKKEDGGSSKAAKPSASAPKQAVQESPKSSGNSESSPGLHINIQVHISADATPDQIDKIFESMAKHIYKK